VSIALPHNIFAQPVGSSYDLSRSGVQFIVVQSWFSDLPQETRQRITDSVYTLQGSKGEVILHAGEEVKGWYAVLNGLVKLQSQVSKGRRQGFLGIPGGEWFGEGSVMKNEPRRYDVVALRDSELVCLPRGLFEELYAGSVAFNHAINRHLNMRLGQAMAIIETMRLRSPEQRVAMYLGPLLWHGSRRLGLSQEELGILSGMSRQTVNAVLNDFERKGLVTLDFGRIEIRDDAGLMAIVFPPAEDPSQLGKPTRQ
jgi:CRP/FNR family cyclic AMP-dependent transcriptional regulator